MTDNRQAEEASGFSVYHTDKYKNVYYDIFTRKAHVITRSEVKRFNAFNTRYAIGLLAALLCYVFGHMNGFLSALIGFGTYLIAYIIFRVKMLNELTVIDHFEFPEKVPYTDKVAMEFSKGRIIILIVLAIVLSALSILNVKAAGYTGMLEFLNYVIAGAGVLLAWVFFLALVKQMKMKK